MAKKNSVKGIMKEIIWDARPEKEIISEIEKKLPVFLDKLKTAVYDEGIDAEIFVGGSYAKNTLVRKKEYDIDVFVRFDWKYEALSDDLRPVMQKMCKAQGLKLKVMHGSRDYFKIFGFNKRIAFEIIPVTKIKRPREERNVTDLSYFHVPYVRRKSKGIRDDIMAAKTFCHAQRVYGAESYIQGFSGYAIECLVIHYKSFEKMLRELSRLKERTVIDPGGKFRRKSDVFFELNENKLHSPVILIDPTYKERNALASLSHETFFKFQRAARKFLRNPGKKFFTEQKTSSEKLRKYSEKKGLEFLHLKTETNKQEGDIAGTKLKKFHNFLEKEISRYFKVNRQEFEYNEGKGADSYFIASSRKEIVKIGPPLKMKAHVKAFKKENRKTYEKNGFVHARIKVDFSLKDFVRSFIKENLRKTNEMSITRADIA